MDGLRSIDMSPDGLQTVIIKCDGSRQVWETQTGRAGLVLPGHSDGYENVLFSPFGERIASADLKGTLRLWCARTGVSVHSFESHEPSLSFVFSPNGRQIATAGKDNTVRFWDTKTGEPGLVLEGHTDKVNGLAYSPSGDQIASCSDDKTVRLWCSLTGEQGKILHHSDIVCQVTFSPDGQKLVSLLGDEVLCCWDSRSGECIDELPSEGHYILFFSFHLAVTSSLLEDWAAYCSCGVELWIVGRKCFVCQLGLYSVVGGDRIRMGEYTWRLGHSEK